MVSETHIFSLFRILSGNFTQKHMYGRSMYLYRSASGFQLSFNLHATLLVHMSFTKINLVFRYNMMYYIKNWSPGSLNCEFFIDFVDLNIPYTLEAYLRVGIIITFYIGLVSGRPPHQIKSRLHKEFVKSFTLVSHPKFSILPEKNS